MLREASAEQRLTSAMEAVVAATKGWPHTMGFEIAVGLLFSEIEGRYGLAVLGQIVHQQLATVGVDFDTES